MIILSIHNKYLIRGGEDESREMEESLLEKNGHKVLRYVIDNHEIKKRFNLSLPFRTIWSQKAYNDVTKILSNFKVDIVHIQNFFPLISPSVYYAIIRKKIPVVQSIRNYRLFCPNALLYRNNMICESCISKKIPYHGVIHKCYRDSYGASFITATMLTVHNYLDTWNSKVSQYIAVSEFVKEKMILGGIHKNKIVVKPNFIADTNDFNLYPDDYFIYIGRLSEEKGIKTLSKAWREIGKSKKLKIIGVGVGRILFEELINDGYNVEILDKLPLNQVLIELKNAKALIVSSEWYEPFGRVVIEAYSVGTPVIANKIGGITELVDDYHTGFFTIPQSVSSLVEKINLMNNFENYTQLRLNSREKYVKEFTAEKNLSIIMEIYKKNLIK